MARTDSITVPIDLKGMIDKTRAFCSIGSHGTLLLHHASERPHGFDGPSEFDEREHWLCIGWRIDLALEPIVGARGHLRMSGMDTQGSLAHHSICVHISRARNPTRI